MVKSQSCLVPLIAASLTTSSFRHNELESSFTTTLLLGDVILVLVICECVFALGGTEFILFSLQERITNLTSLYHMITKKNGLRSGH